MDQDLLVLGPFGQVQVLIDGKKPLNERKERRNLGRRKELLQTGFSKRG